MFEVESINQRTGVLIASVLFVVRLSYAPSIAADANVLRLSSSNQTIAIGRLLADEKKVISLPLQNNLKRHVAIVAVETSCGCAVARPSRTAIGPNEMCNIEVRLSPLRRESVFEKTVRVSYRLRPNSSTDRSINSLVLRLVGESTNRLTFPTVICRGERGAQPWRFRALKCDQRTWGNVRVNCPGFQGTVLLEEESGDTCQIVFTPSSTDAAAAMLGRSLAFTCYADIGDDTNVTLGASVFVVPDRRTVRVVPRLAMGVVSSDGASVEYRIIRSIDAPRFEASAISVTDSELDDALAFHLNRTHDRIWKLTVRYGHDHDVNGKRYLTVRTCFSGQVIESRVAAVFPATEVQE